MNAIEIEQLSRRYGRTPALDALTLAVPRGSVFALLGANGAGKTTTLKVLVNLLTPTAGRATVLGVDSRRLGERALARIGYVAEGQSLPEWMTVAQLLAYCRPFYPTWDPALEAKLRAQFDLPPDRRIAELSRGMRLKAALLASLAYRPRLLVLDEPFGGVDPVVRDDLARGLLAAAELGETTVLLSSHDIEEVERLADHVALLESGRLNFAEPTEALLRRFRRIEVETEHRPAAGDRPAAWRNWQEAPGRVTFVDSAYERDGTERACRERFPEATVRAYPLTLREIFVTLARGHRPQPEEALP